MPEGRARRVLLVGEESAGVQVLRRLLASPHEIVGVLAKRPGAGVRGASVREVAEAAGIPVLPPERVKEPAFAREVSALAVDLILNVHSLYLIRPEILEAARIGAFNLHPGPLPRYAGLNAPSWAVLNGERQHGVTVHWMDRGIDTGDIAYQTIFPIEPRATGLSVAARCIREGVALLERLLDDARAEPPRIPRRPQDRSSRSYYGRGVPHGGRIRWEWPAERLDAFIRAADYYPLPSPWGHPRARLAGEPLGVVRAEPADGPEGAAPGTVLAEGGAWRVACGDGWLALRLVHWRGRYGPPEKLLPPAERLEDGGG
ncbi:MAG: methionyl-tRNA formyltransferase [Acidobacteria bacterium]|nr:MAG: methionyl-tRNA formyltransferase [Acidobacteriota bacterium]